MWVPRCYLLFLTETGWSKKKFYLQWYTDWITIFLYNFFYRGLLCWRKLVEKCFQMEGNYWPMGRETWTLWRRMELLDWWWPWILWISPGKHWFMLSEFAFFFGFTCHYNWSYIILETFTKACRRLGRSTSLGFQCWYLLLFIFTFFPFHFISDLRYHKC